MGGIGSGNFWRHNKKSVIDEKYRLDIRYLHRHGYLDAGSVRAISWTSSRTGKQTGCAFLGFDGNNLHVSYRHRRSGDVWQDKNIAIPLTWTDCTYGGARPWFMCPTCSRRMGVLVIEEEIGCRHCMALVYATQNKDILHRTWNRRDRLKMKLGGEEGLWMKPKWMRQSTWEYLRDRYWIEEMNGWIALKFMWRV